MNIIEACKLLEQGETIVKSSNENIKLKCQTTDSGNQLIYIEGDNVTPDYLALISNDYKQAE